MVRALVDMVGSDLVLVFGNSSAVVQWLCGREAVAAELVQAFLPAVVLQVASLWN